MTTESMMTTDVSCATNVTWYGSNFYQLQVEEQFFTETFVGDTSVEASDLDDPVYSILEDYADSVFDGSDDGYIVTDGDIDREVNQTITFTVVIQNQYNTVTVKYVPVHVTVLDINDNIPIFSPTIYITEILEYSAANTFISPVYATDLDSGKRGDISYGVYLENFFFWMNDNNVRSAQKLVISEMPDARVTVINDVVDIDIYAFDGEGCRGSNNATIKLKLTENTKNYNQTYLDEYVSENQPDGTYVANAATDAYESYDIQYAFVESNVTDFTINSNTQEERVPIGTSVLQVTAVDSDAGLNGQVIYSANTSDFIVNNITGEVTTLVALDYEDSDGRVYTIDVFAEDCGEPFHTGSSQVTITVTDINDNALQFASTYECTIDETLIVGDIVVIVEATDADSTTNGEVTYSLDNNDFSIDDKGVITLAADARFIICANGDSCAEINVTARNGGGHSLYTSTDVFVSMTEGGRGLEFNQKEYRGNVSEEQDPPIYVLTVSISNDDTVNILVININDNIPIFDKTDYCGEVDEANYTTWYAIVTVIATDADAGPNAEITYRITDGHNVHSGIIAPAANAEIDYEMKSNYTLRVKAQDGGTVALKNDTSVYIQVIDVIDNKPTFVGEPYDAEVPGDEDVNATVITVVATDDDSGENGRITYTMKAYRANSLYRELCNYLWADRGDTNSDFLDLLFTKNDYFDIGSNTGEIRVAQHMAGTLGTHELPVKATDHGEPSRAATTLVRITVREINIYAPVFDPSNYTAEVNEDAPDVTSVVTVIATDKDAENKSASEIDGSGIVYYKIV
ncbi:protocadherin Fat 3-like [Saccoglossus kowalevskii]